MKTTLIVLLATVALAAVLGPLAIDAIKGQSGSNSSPTVTAQGADGNASSFAGWKESIFSGKRKDRDDDDDDDD
ncbi:MAG TPA: hypothetical protein VHK70_09830 [Burkholderiaceae bacterium]|nr:hypothetical protein [Burkholderiaceae bacterium]